MNVVVVESPSKAKTINKYLGKDYYVLASFGHVRDLPAKDGSVDPDDSFSMSWAVDSDGEKRIKEIAKAVKGSDALYLATDPDREGEAISWHIQEELVRRKALKGVNVQRVVFNEITKRAILEAFEHPRNLDDSLVQAYLARRALDYLVGFSLSPVLWRKLPGSRSAGRVQSVALRLICERESEIEIFVPQEYWTIAADLLPQGKAQFQARLTHLDGNKLKQFDINNEAKAMAAKAVVEGASQVLVESIEEKETRRFPAPPFTTSTLQQEAARKLGFSATQTMRVAQKLYEGIELNGETTGLITYMRTDGVTLSGEAIAEIRGLIGDDYGPAYLPNAPRVYKSKAKNAQEAHEAIRPTSARRSPASLKSVLSNDAFRLYELIWKRSVACQMEAARLNQTGIDLSVDGQKAMLRATGSVIVFDGFIRLYQESQDDKKGDSDDAVLLPALSKGEQVAVQKVDANQSFTQPPPRYTEASLVKKMEELGIGRPSTYASIIQVLQDRDYVTLDKKRFIPADRGRIVTVFLNNFFERYVEYDFTANLEESLDDVSGGRAFWKDVLSDFWVDFKKAIDATKDLTITEVIDALDDALGAHFFPAPAEGGDARACPRCGNGRLGLKLGRTGGFVGCSNYPECRYTGTLGARVQDGADGGLPDEQILGQEPESGKEVLLKKGPYGWYVQLGLPVEGSKEKPKRSSLPKSLSPQDASLEKAIQLLSMPRELGLYEGEPVQAHLGRYGPYVKCGDKSASLKKDDDVLSIGLDRAVVLLSEAPARKQAAPGKPVGDHPQDGQPITLHDGRYGPYVKHGRLNASLTKDMTPDTLTVEQAVELLAKQAEKKAGKKGGAKKTTTKTAAKKTTAKKTASSKASTAKKASTTKTAAKTATKKAVPKKSATASAAPTDDSVPF